MLEIEQHLKGDESGAYRKDVVGQFQTLADEARQEINKGLAPEEYDKVSSLLIALEAGIKVIEGYNNK